MNLEIIDFRVEDEENNRIEIFTKHRVDDIDAKIHPILLRHIIMDYFKKMNGR